MRKNTLLFISLNLILILVFVRCSNPKNNNYLTIDGFAQGSTFHIVYQSHNTNLNISDSLNSYFNAINKSLSGYDSTSIISKINRGENPPLDSLFIECFNISKEIYIKTDSLFDISAAPLFDMWGFGFKEKETITQAKIDSVLNFVGMDKLSIIYDSTTNSSYLHKEDKRMKVNFNAIAQGYTCDFIGKKFNEMGIENYLLEVGGEILCKGVNSRGKRWSIGIDKPFDGNNIQGGDIQEVIEITNKGVVTSGNYRKFYVENGEKFSHTINPKTGYPVKHNLLSATVIAPTSSIADAYATYLMVIGLEKAKAFISNNKEINALLIYDENNKFNVYYNKQ
jgi:Membrane-associated lipoprotein involved in thiamine biosynthesis